MRVKLVIEKDTKKKSKKESVAHFEEALFEAEQTGNTRKVKALKIILKRLKKC
jgi:hypothetical protein